MLKLPMLIALAAGFLIFLTYGLRNGHSLRRLLEVAFSGVWTAKNVLITFILIGMLTAFWRTSGTIATIIVYSSRMLIPSVFLMITFLLNAILSFLTGTSFGTAATMGVICSVMASTMSIPPFLLGGAVLSGAFFGDRCSPVSSSATLVADVTHTDIFNNIRGMVRTAAVPFVISCIIYTALGFITPHSSSAMDLAQIFSSEFTIHWIALLPAGVILLLSLMHVKLKKTLIASMITAFPICLYLQHRTVYDTLCAVLWGYSARHEELSHMINGGGIQSMINATAIVCLSASYAGIFDETGLLLPIQSVIRKIAKRSTAFCALMMTAILCCMISCNQTLAVMMTYSLCKDLDRDEESRSQQIALDLENTCIVIAPLIPWSIAGMVPLATVNAPTISILAAFYLYLIPLWQLFLSFRKKSRTNIPAQG